MKTLLPLLALPLALIAQTAKHPNAVATDADLRKAVNRYTTTLISPVGASDTAIGVATTTGALANMVVTVDNERIAICAASGNLLTVGVSGACPSVAGRGYDGSSAATHLQGRTIEARINAWYHNSLAEEIKAMQMFGGSGRYVDLRQYGAVCDGSTNVQSAVTAAIAAGYTHLFLPANCYWQPTSNAIPGGLRILGEDWETSKIWPPSPTTTFLTIGAKTVIQSVNLNGKGCVNASVGVGCPVGFYANTDPTAAQTVQNFPGNAIFMDVGDTASVTDPHDSNGITVIERGQGGGIYGQYNGGVGASSGSGIQSYQASNSSMSAGLRSTKAGAGPGFVIDTGVGGETGNDVQYSTGIKTSGDIISLFHGTATWSGNMITANLGYNGTFSGKFFNLANNGALKYFVDSTGNEYHAGYESMPVGAAVASAATITPTGPLFHITGTTQVLTFNVPAGVNTYGHCFHVIPDGAFTTATGGNIAVATTAVVNKMMSFCYDNGTSKYYPSY